jgi:hypothetical protein
LGLLMFLLRLLICPCEIRESLSQVLQLFFLLIDPGLLTSPLWIPCECPHLFPHLFSFPPLFFLLPPHLLVLLCVPLRLLPLLVCAWIPLSPVALRPLLLLAVMVTSGLPVLPLLVARSPLAGSLLLLDAIILMSPVALQPLLLLAVVTLWPLLLLAAVTLWPLLLLAVVSLLHPVALRSLLLLTVVTLLPSVALLLLVIGSIRSMWLRGWVVPTLLIVPLGQTFGLAPSLVLPLVACIEFVESPVELPVETLPWLKSLVKLLPWLESLVKLLSWLKLLTEPVVRP